MPSFLPRETSAMFKSSPYAAQDLLCVRTYLELAILLSRSRSANAPYHILTYRINTCLVDEDSFSVWA